MPTLRHPRFPFLFLKNHLVREPHYPLHLGLESFSLAAALAAAAAAELLLLLLLPLRIAKRAPATACGLSRPVTPPPPPTVRGWGSKLVRREVASELAGRRGVVAVGGVRSIGLGGWSEARRLFVRAAGAEGWEARRGRLKVWCCCC